MKGEREERESIIKGEIRKQEKEKARVMGGNWLKQEAKESL